MGETTKILVVSDNHGRLNRIWDLIEKNNYDYILHAGDYCVDVSDLKALHKNLYFTIGNNDSFGDIQEMRSAGVYNSNYNFYKITIAGVTFLLGHGDNILGWNYAKSYPKFAAYAKREGASCFIFGHTHIRYYEMIEKIHVLNPGSVEFPRGADGKPSYAEVVIQAEKIVKITLRLL